MSSSTLDKKAITQSNWYHDLGVKSRKMVDFLIGLEYWFVLQVPYLESVEIEGQNINLPLTNMSCVAILHKVEGKWSYLRRWGLPDSMPMNLEVTHQIRFAQP